MILYVSSDEIPEETIATSADSSSRLRWRVYAPGAPGGVKASSVIVERGQAILTPVLLPGGLPCLVHHRNAYSDTEADGESVFAKHFDITFELRKATLPFSSAFSSALKCVRGN